MVTTAWDDSLSETGIVRFRLLDAAGWTRTAGPQTSIVAPRPIFVSPYLVAASAKAAGERRRSIVMRDGQSMGSVARPDQLAAIASLSCVAAAREHE